jgi:VanZ family protein
VSIQPAVFAMKWIAVLFSFFIVLVIVLADLDALPQVFSAVYRIPYGDKIGHFVLFGILNYLLTLFWIGSLPRLDAKRVALSVGLILVIVLAAEEVSQQFFPKRTYSLLDLSAGYAGIVLGGWIALKQARR